MKPSNSACCVASGRTDILLDLVAGKMDSASALAIERHASECASCRNFIAAQAEVWAALEADAAPAVSPHFDARLYRRIAEMEAERGWRRAWRRVADFATPAFARPAAAASIALTLAAAVMLTRSPRPEPVAAPSQSAVFVNADVEVLEETLSDFEMLQALGDLPRPL
jgi:hypothetical protein